MQKNDENFFRETNYVNEKYKVQTGKLSQLEDWF